MNTKHESKKDHILNSGLDVMKAHGYNGTSVKDIVDAASVPKGSFYNYFESKEAFAIEALQRVADESFAESEGALLHGEKPPMERLQTYFESGAEYAASMDYKVGCFFGNMCQEMSDSNETIRLKVRQVMKRNTGLIAAVLDEAKSKGQIAENLDSKVMAEFIFNAWEGALMRMKAAKCREPLDAFLKMLPHLGSTV